MFLAMVDCSPTTTRSGWLQLEWSMDGPHTSLSVYLRVIFFGTPYSCVMQRCQPLTKEKSIFEAFCSISQTCICNLKKVLNTAKKEQLASLVMYGIRQCNRIFFCGEISAFFAKIFFQISVVILNSTLHEKGKYSIFFRY